MDRKRKELNQMDRQTGRQSVEQLTKQKIYLIRKKKEKIKRQIQANIL